MRRKLASLAVAAAVLGACTPAQEVRPTKNLIVMITDGTSTSLLATARWYHRYMTDSVDWALNIDPYICALVQSRLSNSIIPDSAPAMSGYMTGIPSRIGNLSIYPEPDPAQDVVPVDPAMAYHPAATLLEAARIERGKATGLVVTVNFTHATPGATAAHSARRWSNDEIKYQMVSQGIDVVFAGGNDLLNDELRGMLAEQGLPLVENDVEAFRSYGGDRLWALWDGALDFEIDRGDDQPSLHEMTAKAIDMLSRDKDGFFLMVEGSKVDYGAHAMDPVETVTEFIEFDKAIRVAMDFARRDGNTTVVILPDHGNSGITLGDRHYRNYASKGMDSMFVNMRRFRASSYRMQQLVQAHPVGDIPALFREWEGIGLRPAELERIVRAKYKAEGRYTDVSYDENLSSVICDILTSRTHIGFTSGNHTGEDVFLAVYNPHGERPTGVITNTALNAYMQQVLGLRVPLSERSEEWFAPYTEVFPADSCAYEGDPKAPVLTVRRGGAELRFPAFHAGGTRDGDPFSLPVPTVYMQENGMFYLPRSAAALLD